MTTVPAHSFSAPMRAFVIAAARFMPGVCAVLISSSFACTTRTPCRRHFVSLMGITSLQIISTVILTRKTACFSQAEGFSLARGDCLRPSFERGLERKPWQRRAFAAAGQSAHGLQYREAAFVDAVRLRVGAA